MKYMPKMGEKLEGGKVFGSDGIREWFKDPRFIVVGHHSDGLRFFVETLGVENSSIEVFSSDSDQFRPIKTEREKVKDWIDSNIQNIDLDDAILINKLLDLGALTIPK